MLDPHAFLSALATVLCAAAVITVVFHRLRLPVVLGYVLAGMVVGPYLPVPLTADQAVVKTLSELGVTLLMFSLGLEFSLRKLVRVGPTSGLIVLIEVSFMLWLGYLIGRLLGWTPIESLFTGAIVSISSTMIIAKTFAERRPDKPHAELVFGILVFEDLMAILLLASLTALSVGSLSAAVLGRTVLRLAAFLIGLLTFGLLLIPRLIRFVARKGNTEMLLISSIGVCSAVAVLAHAAGYSVALGAFLAGSLVAESGEGKQIEHLIHPVRDLFGAVFFVSVGMLIDPRIILQSWREALLLTAAVLFGKLTAVSLGAFLTGHSIRASIQAGMTMAQIGEFSFILAGVGLAQGATRPFLYPVAVAVSVVTALFTPLLVRWAGPLAGHIDRRLPRSLQTFAALYAAWIEGLRADPGVPRSVVRRLVRVLLIDALALAGIAIAASLGARRAQEFLERTGGLSPFVARIAIGVAALLLSVPLLIGLVRSARRLGSVLAERVIPGPGQSHVPGQGLGHRVITGQVDLGAAPRRALTLMMQILVLLLIGAPLLALTQPFLPRTQGVLGALAWAALVGVLAIGFLRSANNLLGHVRAGAEAVVGVLAEQARSSPDEGQREHTHRLEELHKLLTGLGSWVAEHVEEGDPCVGRTLAELNLRGVTGATVLAIQRGAPSSSSQGGAGQGEAQGVAAPGARDVLRVGDVLVLAGSAQSLERARRLLHDATPSTDSSYDFFAIVPGS
ncbi:MAG: cation:proton antiporter [Polyangia bacterium]